MENGLTETRSPDQRALIEAEEKEPTPVVYDLRDVGSMLPILPLPGALTLDQAHQIAHEALMLTFFSYDVAHHWQRSQRLERFADRIVEIATQVAA